jgi:hypothetical protein
MELKLRHVCAKCDGEKRADGNDAIMVAHGDALLLCLELSTRYDSICRCGSYAAAVHGRCCAAAARVLA